jgi:hypothetical protein
MEGISYTLLNLHCTVYSVRRQRKDQQKEARGRILGRNWDKSLQSFPPYYSKSPLLQILPPEISTILYVHEFGFRKLISEDVFQQCVKVKYTYFSSTLYESMSEMGTANFKKDKSLILYEAVHCTVLYCGVITSQRILEYIFIQYTAYIYNKNIYVYSTISMYCKKVSLFMNHTKGSVRLKQKEKKLYFLNCSPFKSGDTY